jgi:23S rRNA (uracil-5-)-methyltransferase RumA
MKSKIVSARPASSSRDYGPPCPHYPNCFGCSFIDLPYPTQLARKRERVVRALAAHPLPASLEVPPVIRSPDRLGYRARVKLVVRRGGGALQAGLYVPESHRVADISSCPVHPAAINRVVHDVKKQVERLGIEPYDEERDQGQLRYLDLRYSFWRREVLLTLVTRKDSFPQGGELARALRRRFPYLTGVVQNINESKGNVIWGERFRPLAGRDSLMERIGFLKLKFPAGTFSQANPRLAGKLYETVHGWSTLGGEETVLDLFCGVGPISLYLAGAARLVWGVDENRLSISAAKQNARINGIGNSRFFAGSVLETVEEAARTLGRVDRLVINPPRKGVAPEALDALLSLNAARIVYVSCDPDTLARDMSRLAGAGYRPLKVQPFDMFPQTEEVETAALLVRD